MGLKMNYKTEKQVLSEYRFNLSQQELHARTTKGFFKEGSRNYNWWAGWEDFYMRQKFAIDEYLRHRKEHWKSMGDKSAN